jgi:hypothetical protein
MELKWKTVLVSQIQDGEAVLCRHQDGDLKLCHSVVLQRKGTCTALACAMLGLAVLRSAYSRNEQMRLGSAWQAASQKERNPCLVRSFRILSMGVI